MHCTVSVWIRRPIRSQEQFDQLMLMIRLELRAQRLHAESSIIEEREHDLQPLLSRFVIEQGVVKVRSGNGAWGELDLN